MYQLKNGSIYIYPTPTENIADGLMVEWFVNLPDVTVTSTEEDIFGENTELRNFTQVIAEGLCADLYKRSRQYDDKSIAEADYRQSLNEHMRTIANRGNSVVIQEDADLSSIM